MNNQNKQHEKLQEIIKNCQSRRITLNDIELYRKFMSRPIAEINQVLEALSR